MAQINGIVGDLEGNVLRCLAAHEKAVALGADLVLFPELAIPGYPPRDILEDESFPPACREATIDLARKTASGPPSIVGTIVPSGKRPPGHPGLHNAACLLQGGGIAAVVAKRLLPSYDVFHEHRWFLPGSDSRPVFVAGRRIGILICEDTWDDGYDLHPPQRLRDAGAEQLVVLNASPYRQGVFERRLQAARSALLPLVYANMVGATDELVFDGRSFALDAEGRLTALLPAFQECVEIVDLDGPPIEPPEMDLCEELHGAICTGIRDFCRKNRLSRAFLGLSGGIDSTLVARLAADALGPEQVTGVAIPSRYTDERSTDSAREFAQSIGIDFLVVPLEALHRAAEAALLEAIGEPPGNGTDEPPCDPADTTFENVQARLRMVILMALVNRRGGLLLNTSNKTELALGYSTLYGDMAGALAPIADLTKSQVYALARHLGGIPRFILERPPTAELAPGQTDPFDYATVSPETERLVRQGRSNPAIRNSEHKRWQMGVILKLTEKSFGTGRLVPITRR